MADSVSSRPTAVVTGALRGIGSECAVSLAQSGFNVLLNDLASGDTAASSQQVAAELGQLGAESLLFACDVVDLDQHARLIDAAVSRWGRIDCLVNNAGVGVAKRGD